tara:strand:+ start:805 stop:1092 length:288 start_codon:yes stop_codon:yes gene_type:complete
MAETVIFKWDTANFTWDNNPYTWDEVELVKELVRGGGSYQETFKDEEKKKKFIKLLCKVQGKEYKETHEVKKVKVKAKDVKLVIKEVLNIDIKIK